MRILNELKYGFYVILHPFKGFWDIKREGRGSMPAALIIMVLCVLTQIIRGQMSGYLFNEYYPENVNAFLIAAQSLILFFLWCVGNWCLTTLMDGEGTLRNIITLIGYCLIPLIFANLINMGLSNILSFEEEAFLVYIDGFSYLWTGFLIFSATAVVHQYSAAKTVAVIVLTVAVMVIFVFLGLLCISLVQQFLAFAESVYSEIVYRI